VMNAFVARVTGEKSGGRESRRSQVFNSITGRSTSEFAGERAGEWQAAGRESIGCAIAARISEANSFILSKISNLNKIEEISASILPNLAGIAGLVNGKRRIFFYFFGADRFRENRRKIFRYSGNQTFSDSNFRTHEGLKHGAHK